MASMEYYITAIHNPNAFFLHFVFHVVLAFPTNQVCDRKSKSEMCASQDKSNAGIAEHATVLKRCID